MKNLFYLLFLMIGLSTNAQVAINTDASLPDNSAMLDVKSITKGLLMPRMTRTQRNAIASPANGLMIYQTDNSPGYYYNSGSSVSPVWVIAGTGSGWGLAGNAGTSPATNFIGTTDAQPLRFRINNSWAGELHPTSGNLFLGLGSGQSNTTGYNNTAIGNSALSSTATGYSNTALGMNALHANTTGSANFSGGTDALLSNIIGNGNTAIGYQTLFANNADYNTATGFHSLYSNISGSNNTANGNMALYANTGGNYNTAIGNSALLNNTNGNSNTAVGNQSLLFNSTGINNTATGNSALQLNTTGSDNTAVGTYSLAANTAGYSNMAIGEKALYSNATGYYNTASGYQAMQSNTYGYFNTATGSNALSASTTGSQNTAAGAYALYTNTTGNQNTAFGNIALYTNVTGDNNTMIGSGADNDLSSLSNNTIIGSSAHSIATNTVVIGYGSFTNTNNLALLGNPTTVYTGGYTNWSNFSDGRFKKDMNEDVKGLDFILRLRPVTYHMDVTGLYSFWGVSPYGKEDSQVSSESRRIIDDAISKKESIRMSGFVAQEVEVAAKDAQYDFDGVSAPTNEKDHYRIAYAEFVVPLVKAVQEQQRMIEELKNQNKELITRLEKLEKK